MILREPFRWRTVEHEKHELKGEIAEGNRRAVPGAENPYGYA